MRVCQRSFSTALVPALKATFLAALWAALFTSSFSRAQQPILALDQALKRVEVNTAQFEASVPSFACDESIVSQELHNGKHERETRVEASFRVTRSASSPAGLTESRDIRMIDGKPANGRNPQLPLAIDSAFSGALTRFLSADSQRCFDFNIDDAGDGSNPTLSFTARRDQSRDPACISVDPSTTGKVLLDRSSMHVIHLERLAPQQVANDPTPVNFIAVDFASVELNGQKWWLPSAIIASTQDVRHGRSFLFRAQYGNYHRFTATSTILPAGSSEPPQ